MVTSGLSIGPHFFARQKKREKMEIPRRGQVYALRWGRAVLAVRAEHSFAMRGAGERRGRGGLRAERNGGGGTGGEEAAYLRGPTAQIAMPVSSPHKVSHHHIIFSALRHV
ncbi:hypothetical protein VZT92_027321 [Zoarces viviparus]|uniref:Uncharacterized protein n=1 Tax=Zoarces viviparus TaxID=48416 RepID=A0AAW1DUR0_ZOAVI